MEGYTPTAATRDNRKPNRDLRPANPPKAQISEDRGGKSGRPQRTRRSAAVRRPQRTLSAADPRGRRARYAADPDGRRAHYAADPDGRRAHYAAYPGGRRAHYRGISGWLQRTLSAADARSAAAHD